LVEQGEELFEAAADPPDCHAGIVAAVHTCHLTLCAQNCLDVCKHK